MDWSFLEDKEWEPLDIHSGHSYPSGALSNFAPHPFVIDGVECASMEGFLQSLKFSNPEIQKEVCKLVGRAAKARGSKKNWKQTRILYWQGQEIKRDSQEYQDLLDRAYDALSQNEGFKKALLASGNAVLTHSIGKRKESETILTAREFCSRLTAIRQRLKEEQKRKLENTKNLNF